MQHRFLSRRQALGLALGSTFALGSGALPTWAASRETPAAPVTSASQASARPHKEQPFKIIVPGAPDGLADNMVRYFFTDRLGAAFKTVTEVENQPGVAGMAALAKAAPDGRTLAFADADLLTRAPLLGKVPYQPASDFIPVASVFALPMLVLATPALSEQDAGDFVAMIRYAQQNPNAIRWATESPASLGHLMLAQIQAKAGPNVMRAVYPDEGQRIADALAGKFEVLAIPSGPAVLRQIKAGQLRPLAVGAPARLKEQLPRVPTLAELDFSDANLSSVFGFFAPRNTPQDTVQKLNQTIDTQAGDAEVRHHIDAEGLVGIGGTAADFFQRIMATQGNIRNALAIAGIQAVG